ncbi:MAG: ACT domain-containing protein [Clostridia bacterium]|nr:ACT domain-containing protein [Clostridia bacterium]
MAANLSKAVVTVLGFDRKGIIAKVSHVLFDRGINILDISQTIVDGYFNMVMVVDITEPTCPYAELQDDLNRLGKALGLQIRIQKAEIFEAMHQI